MGSSRTGFLARSWLGSIVAVALAACGGEDGGASLDGGSDGGAVAMTSGSYLPLKIGAKWTYLVDDNGKLTTKSQAVEAREPVPMRQGLMAYRVVTRKGSDLTDQTVSWQEDTGSMIVRHAEDSYRPGAQEPNLRESWTPHKIRLDYRPEKLKVGAEWTVEYTETYLPLPGSATTQVRIEKWTVDSLNETVMAGGKVYRNCLRIRRIGTDAGARSDKTYWYARGIGKVKETGGQAEELMAYEGL
jgi:hypothetical protein